MNSAPKRRFEVELKVSGDTWEDVVYALRDLLTHIEDHGAACSSVSGGVSGGHVVTVIERPEMTHELYVKQLDAYLRSKDEEP